MSEPTKMTRTRLPGPYFAYGMHVLTAVHRGTVAEMLVFHIPPNPHFLQTTEEITDGMRVIADALGLGPYEALPPDVASCVQAPHGVPFFTYGRPECSLSLPFDVEWWKAVEAGRSIRIMLLFDPLLPGSDNAAIVKHVGACIERGTVRWGITHLDPPPLLHRQ